MHSACHQVEEGTVLNSAQFFYAHPSIFSATVKIESIRLKAIAATVLLGLAVMWGIRKAIKTTNKS
jgi:hypothetical protein